LVLLPRFIKAALDDGYTITHNGLLCWAPLPKAATKIVLRVLFLALESAFSITFWVMHSKTRDYGMPQHLCPWAIDVLKYDGACSHVNSRRGRPRPDCRATRGQRRRNKAVSY
jgi:hypothetical protein